MNPYAGREEARKELKKTEMAGSCSSGCRPGRAARLATLAERGFKPVLFENAGRLAE